MKASDILEAGIKHLSDRAASYDAPRGERSMAKTVAIFNELIGEKLRERLSEEDGWNFMQILKLVRSKQGKFKADSYEDGAAYAALAGEAASVSRLDLTEASHFIVRSGYISFRYCALDAKRHADRLRPGAVVATKDKDNRSEVAMLFDCTSAVASYIERKLHEGYKAMIVWADGAVVYDSFLAKNGDLKKVLEQLKCQA